MLWLQLFDYMFSAHTASSQHRAYTASSQHRCLLLHSIEHYGEEAQRERTLDAEEN